MCTILPDDGQFSFFKRPISNIMPYRAIGLTDVYRYVKGNYAKSRTEELRSITDPKDRKLYKANNFDYCTFSGLFGKRGEKDLLTPSDLLCIDFDHVTDIPRLKKQLIEHEYFDTELLFVSPSGDGIKWIIRQWSQGYSHQDLFRAVANCLRETGVPPVDMSGSDIARACFLPHDPNVYINPKYAEYAAENFSVSEWVNVRSDTNAKQSLPAPIYNKVSPHDDTETTVASIVSEIERMSIDIAPRYKEWCDLGFALAEGLGESGRSYYHRLSSLHHNYNLQTTDKQYTACLDGQGQGITIATFFHMAKNAGVTLSGINHFNNGLSHDGKMGKRLNGNNQNTILPNNQGGEDNEEMVKIEELPQFFDEVYDHLPSFLKDCVSNAVSIDDRDTILLGTLACISACFHNVRGVYDGRITYPNLYLFVVADAGMGKGALTLCGEIVKPIDHELHDISKRQMKDYKETMASFARSKGEDRQIPEEPPMRMLIIPANSSASSFLNILNDNEGRGLLFETEGDTLSQTLRSDYGNYSDVLRKAFHHEQVNQSRRKDREFVDISEPCVSVALAGTPEQVRRLIPDAENGLLSRFCFYNIPFRRGIRDVFATNDLSLSKNTIFRQLGERFMRERTDFMRRGDFTFSLPPLLQAPFTDWLRKRNDECCDEIDNGMQGVIRRMGLVAFRFMMLLTIVREFGTYTPNAPRMPDGSIQLVCHEDDYHTAISIANTLIEHAKSVYRKLAVPEKQKEFLKKENRAAVRRKRLYEVLPSEFTKAEYDKTVADINENYCTAAKWIDVFIRSGQLKRLEQGRYAKVTTTCAQQKQMSTN